MKHPITRETDKYGKRTYFRGTREEPSVTTVLDKFYSDYEYARGVEVAKHAAMLASVDVWHRVSRTYDPVQGQIVESWEDVDPKPFLLDRDYLAGKGNSYGARDRGTIVDTFCKEWAGGLRCDLSDLHDWLDQVLQEGKPPMNDQLDPWAWACEYQDVMPHLVSAWKFFDEQPVELVVCDQWVFSSSLGCGGEVDAIGNFNGQAAVFDFKTSKGPSRRDAIQISVYRKCLNAPLAAYLIYFTADGYRVVGVDVEGQKRCLSEWRRLRKCWDFQKAGVPWTNIKTDVFGVR